MLLLVLHGTWIPTGIKSGGYFMFWGETSIAEPPPKRRGRPPSKKTSKPHPFQAGEQELVDGILQLLGPVLGWKKLITGMEKFFIQLPSGKHYPLASPGLLRDNQAGWEEGTGCTPELTVWEVQGLTFSPVRAGTMLAVLPESIAGSAGVVPAPEVWFWGRVAKFVLELLVQQRFIPTVSKQVKHGKKGEYEARWRPVWDRPGEAEQLKILAAGLPPVCRAVMPAKYAAAAAKTGAGELILPPAQLLVQDFIHTVLDELIRTRLSGNRPKALRSNKPAAAYRWMEALCSSGAAIDVMPALAEEVFREVNSWSLCTGTQAKAGAFRTCFRLEAPVEEDSDADVEESINSLAAENGQDGLSKAMCKSNRQLKARPAHKGQAGRLEDEPRDWQLNFFLQAADDLSLLVPAGKVWREAQSTLSFLNCQFANPQERLLADLGQAVKIFPPLARSLQTACPQSCALTTREAYQFLREAAMYFEAAGLGVQVPSWYARSSAGGDRLGVRLRLKAEGNKPAAGMGSPAGSSVLGLDALINYDWELILGDQVISREEFKRLAALKLPLVQIRGQWVELRPEQVEAAIRYWEKHQGKQITLREALGYRLLANGEAREEAAAVGTESLPPVDIRAEGFIRELLEQLSGSQNIELLPTPANFQGQLRPYQTRGFSWLYFLQQWGIGACLADDMGLGKTIQLIALVLHIKQYRPDGGPVLLLCPTSVVGNWQREVERFAPSLKVLAHHGPGRYAGKKFAQEAQKHNIVLSTYTLAHRDEKELLAVEWDGVVLDEAQNIKNYNTKQSRSIAKLSAWFRIALTGTPVENRLSELWSILNFLNPGYLGSAADFRSKFILPVERYRDHDKLAALQRLVQPFILRRLKTDPQIIQDLPDKIEKQEYCILTKEQATLYEAVVQDMLRQIQEAEGMQRRGMVLSALAKLKQICNHPSLFMGDASALPERSGKLNRLTELLEEVLSGGERALIFTQFARMGELLKSYLQAAFGREVLFLHGGVAKKARDQMVERFQAESGGPPIFVLSLKAGGVGLNLTRANHVFHFDRWWNPAVENQATDRAFRIGQKRNVQVHKFICSGTLEERIDLMIEQKKALADSVIGSGEAWLTELNTEQLRDLLTLRQDAIGDD